MNGADNESLQVLLIAITDVLGIRILLLHQANQAEEFCSKNEGEYPMIYLYGVEDNFFLLYGSEMIDFETNTAYDTKKLGNIPFMYNNIKKQQAYMPPMIVNPAQGNNIEGRNMNNANPRPVDPRRLENPVNLYNSNPQVPNNPVDRPYRGPEIVQKQPVRANPAYSNSPGSQFPQNPNPIPPNMNSNAYNAANNPENPPRNQPYNPYPELPNNLNRAPIWSGTPVRGNLNGYDTHNIPIAPPNNQPLNFKPGFPSNLEGQPDQNLYSTQANLNPNGYKNIKDLDAQSNNRPNAIPLLANNQERNQPNYRPPTYITPNNPSSSKESEPPNNQIISKPNEYQNIRDQQVLEKNPPITKQSDNPIIRHRSIELPLDVQYLFNHMAEIILSTGKQNADTIKYTKKVTDQCPELKKFESFKRLITMPENVFNTIPPNRIPDIPPIPPSNNRIINDFGQQKPSVITDNYINNNQNYPRIMPPQANEAFRQHPDNMVNNPVPNAHNQNYPRNMPPQANEAFRQYPDNMVNNPRPNINNQNYPRNMPPQANDPFKPYRDNEINNPGMNPKYGQNVYEEQSRVYNQNIKNVVSGEAMPCQICGRKYDIDSFNNAACNKECKICVKCRVEKNKEICLKCNRFYSDNEKTTLVCLYQTLPN